MSEQNGIPEFDPQGPDLVYAALADHVVARVVAGDLVPGARLPAERDLAEEYGVAYMTVRRAMQVLRERGVVVTVHGKGTFIAQDALPNIGQGRE
ncbi:winged helix-turn-helix domain-containing protein [Streptomonospora wellingtoniae]|uniref:Winged helix-turn-helix domain-containing protein n=1 Tax=Streptomonospora wellingtoniae TaxID=3075544 RepID=A0ABU2L0S0_9ACTN|nr:winged helix-turn-helix domain-containing protein [Streptomonospora sp. DSM 45055]MDT0304853.1 winged helix-turn-helix domain-containing protein [Streptomonospora sp. DSM 45055]